MSVTYTTHYEFGKQEDYSDLFSMKVITDNWDSLDTILYAFATNIYSINKYAGGRNLLPNAIEAGSYADGKIIVAVNSDGTFTVRTTTALTANAIIPINLRPSTIENGKHYVLSGCPAGGGNSTYCLYWEGSGSAGAECLDSGSGATATPTAAFTRIILVLYSGVSIPTAITFKPMICAAEDWALSHDYQPYALSNAELTAAEKQNENNILSLLPTSYSLPTLIDGTTCTINEGGYITVGNIIVVNVTFTTSVSYTAYSSIMQFPVPKNSGSITMVAAAHIDSSVNVAVNKYGQIALFDTPLPAGTYHFFTVYLKQ